MPVKQKLPSYISLWNELFSIGLRFVRCFWIAIVQAVKPDDQTYEKKESCKVIEANVAGAEQKKFHNYTHKPYEKEADYDFRKSSVSLFPNTLHSCFILFLVAFSIIVRHLSSPRTSICQISGHGVARTRRHGKFKVWSHGGFSLCSRSRSFLFICSS